MPRANPAAVANEGRARVLAASDLLLEIRDRDEVAEQSEIETKKLYQKAGKAFRTWAQAAEQALDFVDQSYSSNRNVMEFDEAQALWELLDQIALDVQGYVQDPNSVLEGYKPLQRAAAPTVLEPFWERWQNVFDMLGAYRDTLALYIDIRRQQPISEVRRFEQDRRTDSRLIRAKLREFVTIARPLMQALKQL